MNLPEPLNFGDILVAANSDSLARIGAHLIRTWITETVQRNGTARIALSGGSTPRAMFRVLATFSLPWQQTEWFWVDERTVPMDSPRSNFGAAREDLFRHVPVAPECLHAMVTDDGSNPEASAKRYEQLLAEKFALDEPSTDHSDTCPVFDLVLLGVGDDGHTASLFPHERSLDVMDRWVLAVPAKGEREARITLTRPVLTQARRVVMLAQGAGKQTIIRKARSPGVLSETPARLTQAVQGELIWLVDQEAWPEALEGTAQSLVKSFLFHEAKFNRQQRQSHQQNPRVEKNRFGVTSQQKPVGGRRCLRRFSPYPNMARGCATVRKRRKLATHRVALRPAVAANASFAPRIPAWTTRIFCLLSIKSTTTLFSS